MEALRKFRDLSAQEVWLLLEAAVLLPTVRLALNFVPVARLQKFGRPAEPRSLPPRLQPQATARMVRIAARHGLYRAKCLEQSLVLRWLLQRQGISAQILFGARKQEERMEAHAWVEVNGESLDDYHDLHRPFSPFEEITPSEIN
jgi:Transglutaminase-like superfamily